MSKKTQHEPINEPINKQQNLLGCDRLYKEISTLSLIGIEYMST